MDITFTGVKDLNRLLCDENACRDYLIQQRWKGNPQCPFCGSFKPYILGDGKRFRCSSSKCRRDFTVRVGTIFQKSRLPLSTWFYCIYKLVNSKKGCSALQISRDMEITPKTAWFLLHRIREMIRDKEDIKISDLAIVDETYCGGEQRNKSKYKRMMEYKGMRTNIKKPVMGLLEPCKMVKLVVVPDTKSFTIKPVMDKFIDKSCILVTDSSVIYSELGKEYYHHEIVNHKKRQYVNDCGFQTNSIESVFALLKKSTYTYESIMPQHLHRYCDEISFRYNTKTIRDPDRFVQALKGMHCRLTYKKLIRQSA